MKSNSVVEKIKLAAFKKWGDRVIGIALYGSFVRRGEYKDIDALIVLEKIDKTRMERIKEIAEIKRVLNFPADILLVSREECIDNFRNHNPLFLDIAYEGKVIYDRGLLERLINKTRLEIQKNKIKREFSRWIFPVKGRTPTALSEITNKDWASCWLEDAERDLKAAEYLQREKLYERAVYHSQQCAEKAVKAVLICFGVYEKTHYVANILKKEIKKREIREHARRLNEIIKISEELEPHVSLTRYPGISGGELWLPYKQYTSEIAKKALNDAKKAVKTGKDFVKWWFESK